MMNKRIYELAKEAGFYVYDDKIYNPIIDEDITKYQGQFAELLLDRINNILLLEYLNYIGNHDHQKAQVADKLRVSIKKYFGIEE